MGSREADGVAEEIDGVLGATADALSKAAAVCSRLARGMPRPEAGSAPPQIADPAELYALGLWPPWAWTVANALKDIENRPWELPARHVGSVVLIHATKKMDGPRAWTSIAHIASRWPPKRNHCHRGALIGAVWFTGCVTESDSPWFSGPYGWTIGGAAPFDKPIPCRGQQRFWRPRELRNYHLRWPPSLFRPDWSARRGYGPEPIRVTRRT